MDFKEFHNLKGIAEKDREPGDAGILVREGQHILEDINLGKTRVEIHDALVSLLPGLDESIINEFTNEALSQKIEKAQLNSFAKLKLETLDASATAETKNIEEKTDSSDFIEKVETPTIPSPTTDPKAPKTSIEKDEQETR